LTNGRIDIMGAGTNNDVRADEDSVADKDWCIVVY